MSDSNSVKTPMDVNVKLLKPERTNNGKCIGVPYRELIGSLMYLAVSTRPDIAFAVSSLSQFNDCFDESHWAAARRVLRYLKGTIDVVLVLFLVQILTA